MKLKLDANGRAFVRDGKPVYIANDGTERGIDGAAAMKLALGKHFETSPATARLNIPSDMAAAFFGDSFDIKDGKLVATDKSGIPLYSRIRYGEAADFDEALGQLIDQYPNKAHILREQGDARGSTPAHQGNAGSTVSRAAFDAMSPADRAKYVTSGGRIGDDASAPPQSKPAAPPGSKTITRTQFDALPPKARAEHCLGGGKITD